jgi:hypothetical protein
MADLKSSMNGLKEHILLLLSATDRPSGVPELGGSVPSWSTTT